MSRPLPHGFGDYGPRDLDFLLGVGRLPVIKTASYTVTVPDLRNVIVMNVAESNTLTIPQKSAGFFVEQGSAVVALNKGAGISTLEGDGFTINSAGGLVSQGQGAWFGAWCLDPALNEWWAFGALV